MPAHLAIVQFQKELKTFGTKARSLSNAKYFKTGVGEYGEGDVFIGVTVPDTRKCLKKYQDELTLEDALVLLSSVYHEERLAACLLFVHLMTQAKKEGDQKSAKKVFDVYIKYAKNINNWDLVDTSARDVVGEYLIDKPRGILYTLATSQNLWERRIAVVATWAFIRQGEYKDIFALSELLLTDKEDLMHKAIGWMLREVGKHASISTLNTFLDMYASKLPRTALRYALEHHGARDKKKYMNAK
jgi:3-methyladenine DNA glycosylase AlkD